MRRHTPTLYPHTEIVEGDEDEEWISPSLSYSPPGPVAPSVNGRPKRLTAAPKPAPSTSSTSVYYSQFLKRYRSADQDDPRNDPDSHYFQRGLGQLQDAGDSDEDELSRATNSVETLDRLSALMPESDLSEPLDERHQERIKWRSYLASVLSGDVLKSESTRINIALETFGGERNSVPLKIWVGIRAKLHGRSEEEELKNLEERRIRIVDPIIDEVTSFRVKECNGDALQQVTAVLHRLDAAQSLYPNLKAFYADRQKAVETPFQARRDALNTWSTVLTSLHHQIAVLKRWTGSETLDVTQPNTSAEQTMSVTPGTQGQVELADGLSFVERLLKEELMQRMFEKGSLVTTHATIGAARDAQVNLADLFDKMNLPTFEKEVTPLIAFPTKLAQAGLRVRLNYVAKIVDPDVLIIDQMTEDLKIGIGLACTLKRQYEAFMAPDPGGKWSVPHCISEDYDATILEALTLLFRLIHWKLKSGAKGIYFKETDFLESQWATMNDVSVTVPGGSSLVAEHLCSLTNKLMVRVINYFDNQIRVPTGEDPGERRRSHDKSNSVNGLLDGGFVNGADLTREDSLKSERGRPLSGSAAAFRKMTDSQKAVWYSKILESVKLRYRKLQRLARVLTQRFSNSAEYSLEDIQLEAFIEGLAATDHFLVYTKTYEEDAVYIVASGSLYDRHDLIHRILIESFQADDGTGDDGIRGNESQYLEGDDESHYLLILSPRTQFVWRGPVLVLELPKLDLDTRDNRCRLIADGPQYRLALAKQIFTDVFLPVDDLGRIIDSESPLTCLTDQQAHLPPVNRELRKITRATTRLAESIVDSVHHVRSSMNMSSGCQELMENWYSFASEHGQHAQKYMDRSSVPRFNRLLIKLAISWVTFICDDCDPNDRRTFKWAVNALNYTFQRTARSIKNLPNDQFRMLQHKVGMCITLLMGHFDILGARTSLEARKAQERQEELRAQAAETLLSDDDDDDVTPANSNNAKSGRFWERISKALHELEESRGQIATEFHARGRVLDNEKLEDRSLAFLANSSSNISIRWQQGKFIGAGAFGSVYLAVNLDTGSLMAVKEIKLAELAGSPGLYAQIKDELRVMEMLHHPNVVEYYGIEVHRDKVYIFEEYCSGGSLAAVLEHGRVEDDSIIQIYTMQMLEGLNYLHSQGIVHRDVKPDNILLDQMGVIKFVDFGAAKILARQRTMQRSRRGPDWAGMHASSSQLSFGAGGMNNSLTGTPMYMSPEVIKNDKRGRHGAMDIWSLGCVVLELATGKKPWSNLDNEWAIMFHIGVATQHPPLPEPGQLCDLGINFIKQCLTIDPMKRPTALELMSHMWMLEFQQVLMSYQEAENARSPPADLEENFENATVAREAAMLQVKEIENIQRPTPPIPPSDILSTPESELDEL